MGRFRYLCIRRRFIQDKEISGRQTDGWTAPAWIRDGGWFYCHPGLLGFLIPFLFFFSLMLAPRHHFFPSLFDFASASSSMYIYIQDPDQEDGGNRKSSRLSSSSSSFVFLSLLPFRKEPLGLKSWPHSR